MAKTTIATIRFTKEEVAAIKTYLRRNPVFESLSSLGRVATMAFIQAQTAVPLAPLTTTCRPGRPSFLWDYALSEAQVHELLRRAPFDQRKWLIARILERLRPAEVFHYLSLEEIAKALPLVRLAPSVKRHWQEAIAVWTGQPSIS